MKALIMSDSHGLQDELQVIKARHKNDVEVFIHCGDSELDNDSLEMSGFQSVRGNCDYDNRYPNDITVKFGNQMIYVTHGHLYNVKMSLMNLQYRAREVGANIVCFGHSHLAGAELIDDIFFINPGSIRLPRMRKERTYAILEIKEKQVSVRFFDIDGTEVPQLSLSVQINQE